MQLPTHCLADLFDQLGLDSCAQAIDEFVRNHQLSADTKLEDAPFWNVSQVQLFIEAREHDAMWVELVDELDVLLHANSMNH